MTTQKIPIVFPDGINLGVWKHAWHTGDVFGHVAELCDGVFLYTPFETQQEAEGYVPDDSYCYPAPTISCEGATKLVAIMIDGATPINMSLEINNDPAIAFEYNVQNDLVDVLATYTDLTVTNDGWIAIENASTTITYRITLTGDAGTEITEFGSPFALNPAFVQINDGFQVCLAVAEEG